MTERMTAAELRTIISKGIRRDVEGPIHKECLEFLEWSLKGAVIHHSPNEMNLGGDPKAKAIAQSKAKALGMRPGWPDIEVLWRGQFWTFEVKAPDGTLTEEQIQCGSDIIAAGGRWGVVRSVDDVRRLVGQWMAGAPMASFPIELRGVIE